MCGISNMSIYEENSVLKILQLTGPINMELFRDRLRLQKIAYLSQELGANGGFNFTFYHYGPYSPPLTKILFKGIDTDAFEEQITLSESETQTMARIQELLGNELGNPHQLELFATVWYLLPSRELVEADIQSLVETIVETKPRFTPDEVRATILRIVEFKQAHNI